MKHKIVVANPAGNITVFVLDDVSPAEFIPLAQKLMAVPGLAAEQVGYLKPAKMGGALRLEMMGGEFCGNATRSFGMLAAQRAGKTGKLSVTVECSGSAELLPVSVDLDAGEAETVMPKPVDMKMLDAGVLGQLTLVFFEGILHTIATGLAPTEEHFHEIKALISAQYEYDALGVMFFADKVPDEAALSMTPAVYVKTTNTLVFESSCGSGTVAAAVWLSRAAENGRWDYRITQPGGVLKATVEKKDGAVQQVLMGGPVTLAPEREIDII